MVNKHYPADFKAVVQEQGNRFGGDNYLAQVVEAALRRYQATGS
ncbi:hypothetical protein [Micromonospora avicenniae]